MSKAKDITCRTRRSYKPRGIRITYWMVKKAFFGMCVISLIVWMYLHLFI